ncbi:aminotransferase class V-fold PLP-dependent enzyme [Corynebacterium frankenforstense]|uniref:aminotransferase class V-fold PLP-dependent enzyme n=1 Tax=Corynebacterium TaxID=1716 RepID=UPI00254B556D|nr:MULTISPECIES: aminotransferase class V-fold PLP-dependent enzyme [Corynebacterium]MDK6259658.1 aminotransferase class V-fold PLP-dependent enzyme [Corynebacterium frankenforstense]MDK8894908.1 aminotransferase class V-fold PLP-dependent enzyme [Corynebacterium sp. MSK006]
MVYDVAEVRGQYVSLGDGWTYLNAHDRPQIPERVAAGVARAFRTSAAPLPPTTGRVGSHTRTTGGGFEGELHLTAARLAVADLVGSSPEKVVLGSSLEQLYATLARAMRPMWRRGSSVLLTNLDRPELSHQLAAATDHVRWAQPDLGTGELPAYQYERLVEPGTRLVSLPAAHELLGTVTPVAEIVDAAHRAARLWVLVDATTYAAYRPVDMGEWGTDIVGVDLARLGGPQLAALVFRDELMLRRLDPVDPAAERGTNRSLEFPVSEGLAGGVAPLVEHLAALARPEGSGAGAGGGSGARGGAGGPRRDRLVRSATEMAAYLRSLSRDLVTFIGSLPAVHILGVTGEVAQGSRVDRVPRISFAVRGVPAETVHRRLLDNGLVTTVAPTGGLLSDMGADEVGGAVTVSLAPFNQSHDIEHLTRVVASLA